MVTLDGNGRCKVSGVQDTGCCAGLIEKGDFIHSVDEVEISTVEDLRDTCRGPPGSRLKLQYRRRGTGDSRELFFLRQENEETGEFLLTACDSAPASDQTSKPLPVSPVTGGQVDRDNLFRALDSNLVGGHIAYESRNNSPVEGADEDKRRLFRDVGGTFSLERRCEQLEVCLPLESSCRSSKFCQISHCIPTRHSCSRPFLFLTIRSCLRPAVHLSPARCAPHEVGVGCDKKGFEGS